MWNSDLSCNHSLHKKTGKQETMDLIEYIHSEILSDIETVQAIPVVKPGDFMTKKDLIE
jgi:hypothetical protein